MLHENIKDYQEVKEKVWGKEFWIVNNQDYCGKVLVLKVRQRCSIHYHQIKKETFFLISGKIILEVGIKRIIMTPGTSITIVPNMRHRFTGIDETSEIVEFSSQHFEDDSYREAESGEVPDKEWEDIKKELFQRREEV